MNSDQQTHVIIGASGGIGSAVTRLLAAQGKSVRAVNRSGQMDVPEGVETMAADATDPESTRQACAGAAVVYNCVHPAPGEDNPGCQRLPLRQGRPAHDRGYARPAG